MPWRRRRRQTAEVASNEDNNRRQIVMRESFRHEQFDIRDRLETVACFLAELQKNADKIGQNEEQYKKRLNEEKKKAERSFLKDMRTLDNERSQVQEELKASENIANGNSRSQSPQRAKLAAVDKHIKDLKEGHEKELSRLNKRIEEHECMVQRRREATRNEIRDYEELKTDLRKSFLEQTLVVEFYKKRTLTNYDASMAVKSKAMDAFCNQYRIREAYQEMKLLPPIEMMDIDSLFLVKKGYLINDHIVEDTQNYKVYSAKTLCDDGQCYDIMAKVVYTNKESDWNNERIDILRYLSRRRFRTICDVYDVWMLKEGNLVILMEKVDVNLCFLVQALNHLEEEDAKHQTIELGHAIKFLHSIGVYHSKLCSSSVYYTAKGLLKLGDLEYCRLFWDDFKDALIMQRPVDVLTDSVDVSTSSESAAGQLYDPRLANAYSFAMIICYMLLGYCPSLEPESVRLEKIRELIAKYAKELSEEAKKMLQNFCTTSFARDLTVDDILEDAWIMKVVGQTDSSEQSFKNYKG